MRLLERLFGRKTESSLLKSGQTDCPPSCNENLRISARTSSALKLFEELPRSVVDARGYPDVFYAVMVHSIPKLAIAFEMKEHKIDYFSTGSQEVEAPGTRTLFVAGDRTNTIPLSEGRDMLNQQYLKHRFYFLRGKDNGIYCFGDDEAGHMLSVFAVEGTLMAAIHRVDGGNVE